MSPVPPTGSAGDVAEVDSLIVRPPPSLRSRRWLSRDIV